MEKYGSKPEENKDMDEILKLFDTMEEEVDMETFRKGLLSDDIYADQFSTLPQQKFLHIIFDKMGLNIKEELKARFGFRSTKLLFRQEASNLIEEYSEDYYEILDEEGNDKWI